jgi:hypothetical protein
MAEGWGGSRKGSGRPIEAARIAFNLFQTDCRQHRQEILARFMQIVRSDDARMALQAGEMILAYGFGKPRETINVEGEVITRYEYDSFDELKQVLIERGLPIDRLLAAMPEDLELKAEGTERDT